MSTFGVHFGPNAKNAEDSDSSIQLVYETKTGGEMITWENWSGPDDPLWFENSADGNCLFDSMAQIFFPYDVNRKEFKQYVQPLSRYIRQLVAEFERRLLLTEGEVPDVLRVGFTDKEATSFYRERKCAYLVPHELQASPDESKENKERRLGELERKKGLVPQMRYFLLEGERFPEAVKAWTAQLSRDRAWATAEEIKFFSFIFAFDTEHPTRSSLRWFDLPRTKSREAADPDKDFIIANVGNTHFRLFNYTKSMPPLQLRVGRFADVFGEDSAEFRALKDLAADQSELRKEFMSVKRAKKDS